MKSNRGLATAALLVASATVCLAQLPPMDAKVGVFRDGFYWVLKLDTSSNGVYSAPTDRAYAFGGIANDIPLTGNWLGNGNMAGPACTLNANGTARNPATLGPTAGIFRPASNFVFILDVCNNGTAGMYLNIDNTGANSNPMGIQASDIPVVGDWNGSGTTKIGYYRPSNGTWYLDFNGTNTVTKTYTFIGHPSGSVADIPVVGDWNGSGFSKIGVFRSGYYWILDTDGDGKFDNYDQAYAFGGITGDLPVVGDWAGTGVANMGVFRGNGAVGDQSYLWYPNTPSFPAFPLGGITGDVPVVANWIPGANGPTPSMPNALSVTCNGASCSDALPGVTATFTFTYYDPENGNTNMPFGDVWVANQTGNTGPQCHSEWGGGKMNFFPNEGTPACSGETTVNQGVSQTDNFCAVSVVSVTPSQSDLTALTVTLNMSFMPGNAGTYNVLTAVTDLDGNQSPAGAVGTWTVDAGPSVTLSPLPNVTVINGSAIGPPTLTITTSSSASGTPTLSASGFPAGMSVSIPAININAGSAASVNVTVQSASTIAPGTYNGHLTVSIGSATQTISTSVVVTQPLLISVSSSATAYTYTDNAPKAYYYVLSWGSSATISGHNCPANDDVAVGKSHYY